MITEEASSLCAPSLCTHSPGQLASTLEDGSPHPSQQIHQILLVLDCLSLGCYNRIHWLGGLINEHLFLAALKAKSLRSGCLDGQVLGEVLLPNFQMTSFLKERIKRGRKGQLSSSFYKDMNFIIWAPPS